MLPMPPKVEGEFQMILQALMRLPNSRTRSSFWVWMAAEWPVPLNMTICSALETPSSTLSAFNMARTGESFSLVSGSLGPTSLHSAMMMEHLGSTSKPACWAIQ